jgi:hypothetical protein
MTSRDKDTRGIFFDMPK